MSLLLRLKKAFMVINQEHTFFDVSIEEQKEVLERFPDPMDDIQRSYFQYRCQNHMLKKGIPVLLNLAAIPLIPFYSIRLRKQEKCVNVAQEHDAVFLDNDVDNSVPDSLRREFHILQIGDYQEKLSLSKADYVYLRRLRKRCPFAFYFRLKCMLKLAMYSRVISELHPKAIICSEEFSFTSSLLTDYCCDRGVEHINVMHGEKLFYIRDSFVHFDRFYVWDQHYVDLFTKLRSEPTQFRIEIPQCLRIAQRGAEKKTVDYTYYLGAESRDHVERILTYLQKLQNKGNTVAIRIHPFYCDNSAFLCEDNRGFLIERKETCTIEESLMRTRCAISLYSTVLLQALLNGVSIVIDDVSAPERYQMLKDLWLISVFKPHTQLSEIIKEENRK